MCAASFCSFLALPHLQAFQLDFSELFSRKHVSPGAWSAVLAYSLVMVFDIGGAMFGLGNLAGECLQWWAVGQQESSSPLLSEAPEAHVFSRPEPAAWVLGIAWCQTDVYYTSFLSVHVSEC